MDALNDKARVTVFVPTYNRAKWVAGAIESVLAQTWPHFRLVVSDNASTDETPEIVARFGDERLSYVRLDEHVELHEHFNLCFGRATTEYLFTLPDDDRMAPDLLERLVPVLDQNPRAGMVHGQATVVGATGRLIAERHGMTGISVDVIESGEEFIRRSMDSSPRVWSASALIRTAALSANRLDGRDIPITDVGHWLRMALDWDMAFVAHPLVTHRIHSQSESSGVAVATETGYIKTAAGLLKEHEVLVRFVQENLDRLNGPTRLLEQERVWLRKSLLIYAGHATLPARQLTTTARTLIELSHIDKKILFEPAAWRLFAGSILGPGGVSIVKGILRPSI